MNLPANTKNLTELILQSVHVKLTLSLDGKIIRAYSRINPDTKNIEIPQLAGKSLSDCANLDLVKKIQSSIQNITVEQQPQEGFITLSSQGGRKIYYEVISIGDGNFFVYLRQELNESIYHQFRLIKDLFVSLSSIGTLQEGSDQLISHLTKFDPNMVFGILLFDHKGEMNYHKFSDDQMNNHAAIIAKFVSNPESWQMMRNGFTIKGKIAEISNSLPQKGLQQYSYFSFFPILYAGTLIGCYFVLSLEELSTSTQDFFEEYSRQSGIILSSIRDFQELAKRNHLLESIFNTSGERAFIVSEDGGSFYISPKLAEQLDIPIKDNKTYNILDFVEPTQKEKLIKQLKQSSEKFSDIHYISFISLKENAELIPFRFRKLSTMNQTLLIGKVFDGEVGTKQTISISSHHMMELPSKLPIPVFIVKEFSFEIMFANNFAHEFLLYSPDELFEKSFLNLFSTTENINLINTVKTTGLKKLESETTWQIEKKDGSVVKTRLLVDEIIYKNVKALIIFFRDITTSSSPYIIHETSSDYQIDQQQLFICKLTPDGTITHANQAYCEFVGRPIEKIVGKPLQESIFMDDYQMVAQHFSKLTIEEPVQKNRNRMVNAFGQTHWVEWTDKAIFENGELVWIDAVGKDITEEFQEEVFQKSIEQRYQALVENLPMVIYVLHPNTVFPVYISPQLEEYLGYRPEEFYNDPDKWSEIIHPDDREEFIRVIQEKIQSRDSSQFEFRVLHKDGSQRWFIESGSVIQLIDGTLLFQGVFLDVSARRKVREKLQYYSKFERLIIEISLKLMNANTQTLPDTMSFVIEELGKFMNVDRAYIFDLNHTTQTMSNSFEWCNQGILPVIDELQGIPFSKLPWWMDQLFQNLEINLDNIENMPPGSEAEGKLLKYQSIKSLLVVPITYEGKPQGFIGFDMVREYIHWEPEAINLLRMVSAMITSTYKKNL
jgi:PAS domain S-box-containing protein